MLRRPSIFALSTTRLGHRVGPAKIGWLAVMIFWLVFAAAPGTLEHRAHLFLGGLCAQRPSHSFVFDGRHLPFDARMTGIYLGSLVTIVALAALGRTRHSGRLSPLTSLTLGLFVAAMGIDGFNSLLVDLGRWHPYEPDNRIRLATGLLTGISLGVVLILLIASSVWLGNARTPRPAASFFELCGLALLSIPFAAVVLVGNAWVFAPLTLLLTTGAVVTVSALALVCLAMIHAPYGLATRWRELSYLGAKATLVGLCAIAVLAAVRLFAERMVGPLDSV